MKKKEFDHLVDAMPEAGLFCDDEISSAKEMKSLNKDELKVAFQKMNHILATTQYYYGFRQIHIAGIVLIAFSVCAGSMYLFWLVLALDGINGLLAAGVVGLLNTGYIIFIRKYLQSFSNRLESRRRELKGIGGEEAKTERLSLIKSLQKLNTTELISRSLYPYILAIGFLMEILVHE